MLIDQCPKSVDAILANSAAADKAVAFLWTQARKDTSKWPEGEISPAILGLFAAKPPVQGGKCPDAKDQHIVDLNIEAMATSFLKTLLK